jgi:hypothetical protein
VTSYWSRPNLSDTRLFYPCSKNENSLNESARALVLRLTLFICDYVSFRSPRDVRSRFVTERVTAGQTIVALPATTQYRSQVASGQKPRPARRYVSVQTLDPNENQRAKCAQTRAAAQQKAESKGQPLRPEWADPSSLHCIMVLDVVTHESVGTSCYVVSSLPSLGNVSTYDTFPAEFVASSAEFLPE